MRSSPEPNSPFAPVTAILMSSALSTVTVTRARNRVRNGREIDCGTLKRIVSTECRDLRPFYPKNCRTNPPVCSLILHPSGLGVTACAQQITGSDWHLECKSHHR